MQLAGETDGIAVLVNDALDSVAKNFGFTPRSLKSYLDENPPD